MIETHPLKLMFTAITAISWVFKTCLITQQTPSCVKRPLRRMRITLRRAGGQRRRGAGRLVLLLVSNTSSNLIHFPLYFFSIPLFFPHKSLHTYFLLFLWGSHTFIPIHFFLLVLTIAQLKGAYPNGEYHNNSNYGQQSWHETLDKAVKGRQEKGNYLPSHPPPPPPNCALK